MERKGSKKQLISFLVCLCLLASIAGAGSAWAYNEEQWYRVYSSGQCPGCDLSGAELSGFRLERGNLSGADLKNAIAQGVRLEAADLSGADLRWADLRNADMVRTKLTGAKLTGAKLAGANLYEADLSEADLSGVDLSGTTLILAKLRKAKLIGAKLPEPSKMAHADLTLATRVEKKLICAPGSIGQCIEVPPNPKGVNLLRCLTPYDCMIPDDPPAGSGTLAMMYYIVYEGEDLLCVVETTEPVARVPKGFLRYGRTYTYYVLSISTSDEIMDFQGPVTFTVDPKPAGEDDYGNPLAGQTLTDAEGNTITLADTRLATLIAAGSGVLSQASALSALQAAGGIVLNPKGTDVTINTNDVHVARTSGGTGPAFVMAASATHTIGTIIPLTASGYTVDRNGKMKTAPEVTVFSSNVNLPFGLFDFAVLLGTVTNRAEVVIVPPAPFGAGTKWYKVASDGTVKEYPHFVVDAAGNGILTLYDNDEWDANRAWGIIRDPGGPGTPALADGGGSGGGSGCFIATAAYGSYLHPYVKVLRMFRDTILLSSSMGSSFVRWYYRVSPPVADVIARHRAMGTGARVMLLPVIGVAWVWVNMGTVPVMLMLLLLGAAFVAAGRLAWRRRNPL